MSYYRNWKEAGEYNYAHDLDKKKWAWEFLRRNPEYWAYWDDSLKIYNHAKQLYLEEKERLSRASNEKLSGLMGLIAEPIGLIEGILLEEDMFSIETCDPEFWICREGCEEKWGIPILYNPENDSAGFFQHNRTKTLYKNQIRFIQEHERGLIIRLSDPVSPQLQAIKKLIVDEQNRKKIKPKKIELHPTIWISYLRVLDCEAEDETRQKKAAGIIFPHHSCNDHNQYRSALKLARKLAKEGYRRWL